ncbi:MAG: MFS transporter [Desulfobulbaceae bacterium]|uniref:MFS transporter n=1 Tax=Candidatus Desulfatifera sulfidica TaxID=2841691 RepID=A0A8J6NB65_9BACT|nr:MFS transporter [Candidatus Desulfatifera sulfidica]
MTNRERSILTVSCYGHFMSHFNMLVFPAILLPLAGRLQMPMIEILALSFWMYLLFGITALPWGILADRIGPRPLLALFHLGAGISALWAAMNMDNAMILSLALAGIGLFSGIYHPAGLGWIAKEVEKTSRAMAYNGMFGNLGLAMAPLLAGIVNYFWGAVAVYGVVGILNLVGLMFLYLARGSNGAVRMRKIETGERASTLRPFLVLLICMMLGGVVYRGITVSLPAYFELRNGALYDGLTGLLGSLGSANVVATGLISIIYLVGMGGQFLGGRMGERFDLRRGYFIFHLITIPLALLMAVTMDWWLVGFALVHSFFLLGMQPIENTLVARLSPPNLHSSAYGLKFVLTFGIGALSVKMVGWVEGLWNLNSVYVALALVSLLLVATIAVLARMTPPMKS